MVQSTLGLVHNNKVEIEFASNFAFASLFCTKQS